MPKILDELRSMVEAIADPKWFDLFDHNIRRMGREGLLADNADVELVKCQFQCAVRPRQS
jgi:hypothetical protein